MERVGERKREWTWFGRYFDKLEVSTGLPSSPAVFVAFVVFEPRERKNRPAPVASLTEKFQRFSRSFEWFFEVAIHLALPPILPPPSPPPLLFLLRPPLSPFEL